MGPMYDILSYYLNFHYNCVGQGLLAALFGRYPGGRLFDPIGFSRGSEAKLNEYKTKEIKNGRLAILVHLQQPILPLALTQSFNLDVYGFVPNCVKAKCVMCGIDSLSVRSASGRR